MPYASGMRRPSVSGTARAINDSFRTYRSAAGLMAAAGAGARYLKNRYYGSAPAAPVRRRRPRRLPKKRKALSAKVAQLSKQVSANEATYTKKHRYFQSAIVANTSECDYDTLSFNATSILEGVIDAVKYFNPAAPATLVTVDLTSPTYQQAVRFTRSFGKITAKNNYGVACRVTLYIVKAKADGAPVPTTCISNSLADESNATITSPLIFPTDCHEFNDFWKIAKSKSALLQPGAEVSISMSMPAFDYDVSRTDSVGSSYQKYFHGSVMMVRVEGPVAHGSTSGICQSKAGVDIMYELIHTVKYSAGVNVNYIEVSDNPTAISGTVQVSAWDTTQETYTL